MSTRSLAVVVSLLLGACGFDAPGAMGGDATPMPQQPTVGFASEASSADEQMPDVGIAVTLSAAHAETVTVAYAVAGGTATPDDFTLAPGTLTFAPGETQQTIALAIVPDSVGEDAETIELALSAPTGATLGTAAHTITIANDRAPRVQFASATTSLDEGTAGMVELVLDKPAPAPVSVRVHIAGGTASAADYTFDNDVTVTFPAGQTSQTVALAAANDTIDEDAETVALQLVQPSPGLEVGVNFTQDVTLVDTDAAPTVSFLVASSSSNEFSDYGMIVRLSAASGRTVRVPFQVVMGTNAATGGGTDYAIEASPIVFAPGDTEETILVDIATDTLDETDETIDVDLVAPADGSATLGAIAHRTHTIVDNDELTLQFVQMQGTGQEGDSDRDYAITVTLGATSTQPVTVDLVVDAMATSASSSDFAISPTTLTFAPGETSQQFTFTVRGDNANESTEAVVLELANPTGGATLGTPSRRTIYIADDDGF